MKYQLVLILDHGELVDEILHDVSRHGYNATVVGARSIKHMLEDEESEHVHFLSLRRLDGHLSSQSTYCYFIVEEEKLESLKKIIRDKTESFSKIKGAMYSFKLDDFEGSF